MAYQTLGNRVLGGIGAPGGGMAESFNAGVNTSLNQRTARQNMAAQAQTMATAAQELKWKEEDRKIAAQQRAAAAAARAKAQAYIDQMTKIQRGALTGTTTAVGVTPQVTPGMARDRQGANVNPRYYPGATTTAPATATAPAVYTPPKLSFSLGVQDGAPAKTPISFKTTAQAPVGVRTATAPAPAPVVTAKTPAPAVTATTPAPVATGAVGNMQFVMPKDSWLWPGIKAGQTVTLTPSGRGYTVTMPNGQTLPLDKDRAAELLAEQGSSIEAVLAAQTSATAPVVPTAPVVTAQTPAIPVVPTAPVVAAPAAAAPAAPTAPSLPYATAMGVIVLNSKGVLELEGRQILPSDPLYNAVSTAYSNFLKQQAVEANSKLTTESYSPLFQADPYTAGLNVTAAKQAAAAAQAAVGAAPIQYPVYDGRTSAPVGQLPAGVRAPVTADQTTATTTAATAATPSSMDFGVGFGAGQTPLSFGPSLGAQPQTPEDMMIDEFARQTTVTPAPAAVAGQAAPPAAPVQPLPNMGKPGQPNQAINILLSERDIKVQIIQAQLDAGMLAEATTSQIELAAIDSKLQGAVGQLAIEELRDYNAPQRLNEIWTQMKQGRNYEFVPLNDGSVAVYVDGKLQIDSAPMDKIIEQTLSMTNQTYVEQQAALAAVQADAYAKAYGESQGKLPAALETAANAGDIAVVQAQLLAGIEIDKDGGLKNNETLQKYIEYTMQQQGQLPKADKTYHYEKMSDGSVGVYDGPNIVSYYFLAEEAGPNNTVNTVIREQKVGQ